jgi:superfamily II helicase
MIEFTGRYKKIPREELLCEICQSEEVEDEYHFVFASFGLCQLVWSLYSNQREPDFYTTLMKQVNHYHKSVRHKSISRYNEIYRSQNTGDYFISVEIYFFLFYGKK